MEIRLIQPEEWAALEPIYRQEGGPVPHADQAISAAAFDDHGIAGFWSAYGSVHAGPLWVRPDKRGTGLWRGLNATLESGFDKVPKTGYFCFSGEPKVEVIFKKLGLVQMPYKVWKREF